MKKTSAQPFCFSTSNFLIHSFCLSPPSFYFNVYFWEFLNLIIHRRILQRFHGFFVIVVCLFQTGSCCVGQGGLEFIRLASVSWVMGLKACATNSAHPRLLSFYPSVSLFPLVSEQLSEDTMCTRSPSKLPFLPVFPSFHFYHSEFIRYSLDTLKGPFFLFLYSLSTNSVCQFS